MGVAAVVNAVGLDEFEERFFDDDRLCVYGTGDEDGVFDERSTGAVVSRLIREATHVLELPVVGRGCLSRHVDADGECACRDICVLSSCYRPVWREFSFRKSGRF